MTPAFFRVTDGPTRRILRHAAPTWRAADRRKR
jgi:hypothetical protein